MCFFACEMEEFILKTAVSVLFYLNMSAICFIGCHDKCFSFIFVFLLMLVSQLSHNKERVKPHNTLIYVQEYGL